MMSDIEDDERVGPGRPPRQYRFAKGTSGNPRGRPRGSLNRETLRRLCYEELFDRTLSINGRRGREKISCGRALFRVWVQQGLNKDPATIEKILAYAARLAAEAPDIRVTLDRPQDDEAILRQFLEALNRRRPSDQGRGSQVRTSSDESGGGDD